MMMVSRRVLRRKRGNAKFMNPRVGARKKRPKGKIAGLDPMNFVTFVTPHLGSRLHKQIPILCGSYMLEKIACHISWVVGRTGKHLILKDHDNGKPPRLLQMVHDCGGLKFISALQAFKHRGIYATIHFNLKTASIRHQNELPKRENFAKNGKYPHILSVEKPKPAILQNKDFSGSDFSQLKTLSQMEGLIHFVGSRFLF